MQMTPSEELEYLQKLVATAESIAALGYGDVERQLSNVICDKIDCLLPEEELG